MVRAENSHAGSGSGGRGMLKYTLPVHVDNRSFVSLSANWSVMAGAVKGLSMLMGKRGGGGVKGKRAMSPWEYMFTRKSSVGEYTWI